MADTSRAVTLSITLDLRVSNVGRGQEQCGAECDQGGIMSGLPSGEVSGDWPCDGFLRHGWMYPERREDGDEEELAGATMRVHPDSRIPGPPIRIRVLACFMPKWIPMAPMVPARTTSGNAAGRMRRPLRSRSHRRRRRCPRSRQRHDQREDGRDERNVGAGPASLPGSGVGSGSVLIGHPSLSVGVYTEGCGRTASALTDGWVYRMLVTAGA